ASPPHVEIDRVLLLALVPILVELGLPVLRMERVAVVARAPGQEHQRTEKCEPCNRDRAPPPHVRVYSKRRSWVILRPFFVSSTNQSCPSDGDVVWSARSVPHAVGG